jgi:hypothetical protein
MLQGVVLPALYWPADKVGSQTPGWLRLGDLSLVYYNTCHIRRSAWSESTDVLSCTSSLVVILDKVVWNLLEGLQEVVWAANLVGWAHCQVDWSSGRLDPLIGDDCEPGRWGPRGIHVSRPPVRPVPAKAQPFA